MALGIWLTQNIFGLGQFRNGSRHPQNPVIQSAAKLGVSCKTLSDWETGRIFPSLTLLARIVEYLGYDPFVLGMPKGNETHAVAF